MDELKMEECHEQIWQVHLSISDFFSEYAASVGLTFAAFKVLGIIYKRRKCTQKEIIQLTYLPKQTVNAIINNFNKQEIIQEPFEAQNDKRNKVITFTKKGEVYAEEIISKIKNATYRALNNMGEDKRNSLIESITLFRQNLYLDEENR